MSLKIKKRTDETLDIPPDYVIESEKNNPVFSNRGSQSVSIAFPVSDNNLKILGHAGRLDRLEKPDANIRVIVESDALHQAGLMVVNAASDKSISANIGWDESELYASMGATLLRDMRNLPVFEAGGTNLDTRVDAMLAHLTSVMKEQLVADYFVFPIVLKMEEEEKEFIPTGMKYMQRHSEVLNEFKVSSHPVQSNGAYGELLALENRILQRYIDSEIILFEVPKGYGVSPFLKVGRLLELIFEEHFGYILAKNPFNEHQQLKKLVVLNNTIDAVVTGRLNYQDLMPDMSIKEFLDALYNKFGLQYFLDSNTKSVSLIFLKDMLAYPQSFADFTKYKTEPVKINYTQNKQLRLVANREIEGAEVQFNTFEDFLKAYNYQFKDTYYDQSPDNRYTSQFNYLRKYTLRDFAINSDPKKTTVSSDFFDWDKKSDLPYEEIKMNDLCLPVDWYDEDTALLHYLIGYKHAYSDITISGVEVESEQGKTKLAFAFGWGKTNLSSYDSTKYEYFFASQDNCDVNGRIIINTQTGLPYDISLTCHREDGLFNRFWKGYDAFIRHSAYSVETKLKLPETEIFRLNMYQPVSVDNQPLIPEQIKFKQNKPDDISECKFKTMRMYEPFDLNVEQEIVAYHPQEYYWNVVVVKNPDVEAILANLGVRFTIEGFPFADGRNRQSVLLLPPTADDLINGQHRTETYQYVVIDDTNYPTPVTMTIFYNVTSIT